MSQIDWLILTAANRTQARGYEHQLAQRNLAARFGGKTRWAVVPDPGDRRVGSGTSTLWVLLELARQFLTQRPEARRLSDLFAGQRIVIIHSGGDSRRLVAYAGMGKIFLPLPCKLHDEPAALFDLIALSLAHLPAPSAGQVLIASGDVLLTFDPDDTCFDQPGVTGVAYPTSLDRGAKHGVYVASDKPGDRRVLDFLQKPSEEVARQRRAVDAVGRVLVDTGLISLDPTTVERWLRAAGVRWHQGRLTLSPGLLRDAAAGRLGSIDLYEQILMALPPERTASDYLAAVAGRGSALLKKRLSHWHRSVHGQPFHVNVLPYCEFFHVGSTREMLASVGTLNRTSRLFNFANYAGSVVADRSATEGAFIYNSVLQTPHVRCGPGTLLESCHIPAGPRAPRLRLPGGNVVVGYPADARADIDLPSDLGLVCLPCQTPKSQGNPPWTVVHFGVADDFKTSRAAGGTALNQPLDVFLAAHDLDARDLWPESLPPQQQTLWNARLWPVGPINQVLRLTRWMRASTGQSLTAPPAWRRAARCSMEQLLPRIDHDRLLAQRRDIARLALLHDLPARLQRQTTLPATEIVQALTNVPQARVCLEQLGQMIAGHTDDPLLQARLLRLAQAVSERFPQTRPLARKLSAQPLDQAAFAAVARSVAGPIHLPNHAPQTAILPDQVVWVTTPIRLDFHGGWSDTPPICAELGGTVLNAAITLNGQYPVQVIAKLTDRPRLTLTSMDLGESLTLSQTSQVLDYHDPTQWSALPKAALVLAGICPARPEQNLSRWLKTLGGGLDITFFAAVPKGSGLGTSSILGAAMLACLSRVTGENLADHHETLIERTSLLEQMMTTGGGWQDQVGGILPGVKLIRTTPGPRQTPSIHWTGPVLTGPDRQRLLLYYTGCKRMARNILQRVVSRYLARDPEVLATIHRLKAGAEQMKRDLDAGNLDAFARGVDEYWRLKCTMDPGATNPTVEAILRPVQKYLVGKVLPGAGGGGFVFMVARDLEAAAKVRAILTKHPPNPLARFFDFDFDAKGLAVTVL